MFAWRAPLLKQGGLFAPVSREGALVLNNLFLVTACMTVFVGTLYPLALEALTGEKISVGAPFFNATFGPLFLVLMVVIPFGPLLAWKRGDLAGGRERIDPALERIDICLGDGAGIDRHAGMCELLEHFHGELEAGRSALCPPQGDVRPRLAVEGAVDLNAVEALGVEGEFVEAPGPILGAGVEDAVPGAPAAGIVPARGADAKRHADLQLWIAGTAVLTVNEIFHSIQGESTFTGEPCVFVRLTACDLRCRWCDTAYAFHEGRKMSVDDVAAAVDAYGCPTVEITGGEPLLQADVYPLMTRLLDSGKTVRITQPNRYRHAPEDQLTWDDRVWISWEESSCVVVTE